MKLTPVPFVAQAMDQAGQMFGVDRLDQVLGDYRDDAADIIGAIPLSVERFTEGRPPADDRTLVVAKVF